MSKQKTKTQDSATIQVQNLAAQNKFYETLQKVFKDVENLSTEIAKCLKDGLTIKLSNKMIMEIYNVVYGLAENACQLQIQDKKQQNVTKTLETEIQDQYTQFLKTYLVQLREYIYGQPQQAENILQIFNEHAVNYKAYSFWLRKIYYYLDKFIIKGSSLNAISLRQFKIEYFDCLKPKLLQTIFYFVHQFRNESIPVPQNLKSIIEFYEIIDINEVELKYDDDQRKYVYRTKDAKSQKYYAENLEQPFLKESEKYYLTQIEENKNLLTIEFVHWANKIINKEEEIIHKLFPRSQKSLKNKFELHIIKNQSHWLVNHQNGLKYMLQMEQLNDIATLYKFCIRVKESVSHIARAFFEFFDQEGNIINQTEQEIRQGQPKSQAEQAELYFQKIIQLMNRAQNVLEVYMDNNIDIQSSYNSAFGSILNKNDKTPLWLSIYCDMTIRNEKNNTNDVDSRIHNILRIFKLIHHRDVFFKHYQKFLSIRLLIPNANIDIEKQLVQKFRGETGTNILSSLSMMINDIDTSRRFQEDIDQGDKYLECNINLISQGCWPQINILTNVNPPQKILNQIGVFEQKFKQKFQQREIIWNYGQGTGEINFKTNNKNYQLSVSTLQIVSFTQFNKEIILTVQQLMDSTNMTKVDLENSLIPFVCFKILKREKADLDEFTLDEKLRLDLDYQNKSLRLKLQPNPKMQPSRAQQKQNMAAEEKQMNEEIQKQREYIVDSQIVRLMKSRKTIPHSDLIEGCEKTINIFKPEIQFIKKRIEHLIDKDYIKRDEKDWNIYHYIN